MILVDTSVWVDHLRQGDPALVEALADDEFDVRMRAAKALGAVGGEHARRALVGALTDENRWSVIRIADLLAEMGPQVVGELIDGPPDIVYLEPVSSESR